MPDVEYDQRKHLDNIRKHGIGFDVAAEVFERDIIERRDERFDYGEDRFVALVWSTAVCWLSSIPGVRTGAA